MAAVAVIVTVAAGLFVAASVPDAAPSFRLIGEPIVGDPRWAGAVAVTESNGRTVAIVAHGDQAQVWDLSAGKRLGTAFDDGRSDAFIDALAVGSMNGRQFVAGGGGGDPIRMWDLASGEDIGDFVGVGSSIALGQVNGKPIAVAGDQAGRVGVWHLGAGRLPATMLVATEGPSTRRRSGNSADG
ncbi:hypothetical protein ACBJ59_35555 [Nonomuraea sp. MTCD27]|uniref:hypothetical protein n=1 Tax=Nonomuraea sp. MTCD27 TaxID=1676747 RepID=UPI0035C10060